VIGYGRGVLLGWLRRLLLVGVVATAGGLVGSACSSSSARSVPAPPSSEQTLAASTCGYLYTVIVPSGRSRVGGCAGALFATYAPVVGVRVGQSFRVDAITDMDNEPVAMAPVSNHPGVVVRLGVSGRGGDGQYKALSAGTATLMTSSPVCNGGPIDSTVPGGVAFRVCPVLHVDVTG